MNSSFFDELTKIAEEHKLQGHTNFQGIPIAVENRKGSVRKGTDSDGNEWRTEMKYPYGYVKGTKGADGEEIDVYVGPNKESPNAFVVHQKDKDTGKYDEDKCFLGFDSKKDTREAFLKHYDSPKFLGPISKVPIEKLKEKIREGKQLTKISSCVEFEKNAVDPLTLAGLGALSHVGANLAVKAGHGTKFLRNVRSGGLARGIRSGIEGKPQGIGSRMLETWAGPELVATEHAGRGIGKILRGRTPHQQKRALKKLRKAVAMNPNLKHTPIMEDVVGGVTKAIEGGLPKAGPVREAGRLARAAAFAPAPILAATEPSALVHMGINVARKGVAQSKAGKEFMRKGMKRGLVEGGADAAPSVRERIMDVLVSPAALHTERMGRAMADLPATASKEQLARLTGASHSLMGQKRLRGAIKRAPKAAEEKIKGEARQIRGDIQEMARPAPRKASPAPSVGATDYGIPLGVRW